MPGLIGSATIICLSILDGSGKGKERKERKAIERKLVKVVNMIVADIDALK